MTNITKKLRQILTKPIRMFFGKYCSQFGTDFGDPSCGGCKHMELCVFCAKLGAFPPATK